MTREYGMYGLFSDEGESLVAISRYWRPLNDSPFLSSCLQKAEYNG